MSRYEVPSGSNEWEPGSGNRVLRNHLGIKGVARMDRTEYEALVRTKFDYFETIETDTRFSVEIILRMHRDWLGEIYPFAGRLRTIDLTAPPQGDVPAFRFCHAAYLANQMENFAAQQLAQHTPCRADSVEDLSGKLAEVHAEFIALHPFREGNGRVGRWVTELMALQAGFPSPDHGFSGPRGPERRQEYYRGVSVALHRAAYEPLARHYADALSRAERSFRP